ncbi:MAG: O-antigen ligase family protein, partial [Thermoleophilia bacterium]
ILLLWAVLVYRRARLWTVPLFVPALLCLVMAIGSVVVGDVRTNVAVFALRVLFQPLLFYFIGFLFPKNKRWVQWTVAVFLVAGVALAAHGLFQYVTHAPMPTRWVDASETHISTRAYSIIENPNGLGAILLIGTLISFSLALGRGLPRIQRLLLAAVCAVQLAGVAVTFSRGAWLGLAAGVFALLILAYRRYLVPLVAVGALGWFVAPARFTERLVFAFSSTYIAKSMVAGRLLVWKMALQHAAAHPLFGLGLGTFGGTAAVRFGYGRLWVDNFYLQLAAEGGVILLIAFLWVLLRAAKGLVKAYVQSADPYLQPLAAGTFGAFIAVAAANVTASVWETLVVGVAFWFFAGLVTSAVLHAVPCEECRNTVVGETVVGAAGATRNMPPDAALDRSVS